MVATIKDQLRFNGGGAWRLLPAAVVALLLLPEQSAGQAAPAEREAAAARTLDELHAAASAADFDRYFSLFAEQAVFLGTDATERWTRTEFMAYVRPHFDRGRGWTYRPIERHIHLSEDGSIAWFDERLDNDSYGETRGTGVLQWDGGSYLIAQYNLTIPVPNEVATEVVEIIRRNQGAP